MLSRKEEYETQNDNEQVDKQHSICLQDDMGQR